MKIYLDLDDVLNQLTMPVLHQFGCKRDYPIPGEYDIIKASPRNVVPIHFWNSIDWTIFPKSEECDWLLENSIRLVGKENIFIVTQLFSGELCQVNAKMITGKLAWIEVNLPEFKNKLIFTHNKALLAQSGTVLIDDYDQNVTDFIRAGGTGVLVPRPWNRMHKFDTMEILKVWFELL